MIRSMAYNIPVLGNDQLASKWSVSHTRGLR